MIIDIEKLRTLISRATPGPILLATSNSWRRIEAVRGGEVCCPCVQPDGHVDLRFPNGGAEGPDAELLIAAYNALPALLDHIDALEADNKRLREPWQPIETAPRDGEIIILALIDEATVMVREGRWDDKAGKWTWPWICDLSPALWMPLPAPSVALSGEVE